MTNKVRMFISETGVYTGGYTSEILYPHGYRYRIHRELPPLFTRGIIQVEVTSGDITLQARLDNSAPWMNLKTWDAHSIEELVIPFQMRIIVSDSAKAWLGELI